MLSSMSLDNHVSLAAWEILLLLTSQICQLAMLQLSKAALCVVSNTLPSTLINAMWMLYAQYQNYGIALLEILIAVCDTCRQYRRHVEEHNSRSNAQQRYPGR